MVPKTQPEPAPEASETWAPWTRFAFRLAFVYFGLYCLGTQILGGLFPIPALEIPDPATITPFRQIVFWTAAHAFGIPGKLIYTGSGSGDKTFDWVFAFCVLVAALTGAGLWSALDRRRLSYPKLYPWFRLCLRFALGAQLLLYGMDKAIPLQMPFPYLTRLVEPYGNFSPMGVLWSFVGASPAYEICVGCAELLGGVLLLIPRTALLGALADMTQVFLLNMTYDVPVKLFSFHLLVMSLVLLAPDLGRLYRFLLLRRATEAAEEPALFRSRRANRIALAAQVVFGLLLVAGNAYGGWRNWFQYGGGREKSPLYGIWDIRKVTVTGGRPSPWDDWRRAIFDFPANMAVQRKDNAILHYRVTVHTQNHQLAIALGRGAGWFQFERPSANELTLAGDMDGQPTRVDLGLVNHAKFVLVDRRFHWIQEYPSNR